MAPVHVDDGGNRRGRSASRHLGLQKKKSSGSSRRRPRLKKKTIKDDDGSSRRRPRLKKEAIKDDSSRRGQQLKKKTIQDEGGRVLTEAERETYYTYYKQVLETGGFDVVDVPTNVMDCTLIRPKLNFEKDPQLLEVIERCSMKAIDVYNRKHRLKGKYKFVRVLKLCSQLVAGFKHYITFEAKAEAADPVCFQAVVYIRIVEEVIEVLSCRLKPES